MVVTIHWWGWAIIIGVVGMGLTIYAASRPAGDYDFGPALYSFLFFVMTVVGVIAFLLGHFLA